jgi:hypothetical protein
MHTQYQLKTREGINDLSTYPMAVALSVMDWR